MILSGTVIRWRGAELSTDENARHWVDSLDGWEDSPSSERQQDGRPLQHGSMGAAPLSRARVVRTSGMCRHPESRDQDLAALGRLFALADPEAPPEELTITHAGRTLTAWVYVTRFSPPMALWGAGLFSWRAEWQADDPLRYGPPVQAATGFPTRAGGLRWPLFSDGAGTNVGALDYGPPSASGRTTLTNTGVTGAAVQHEITGPIPAEGFEIITIGSGDRLVYEGPVGAGSRLVLDGATGAVVIDGVSDRSDVLTVRQWTTVRQGQTVSFAFVPRGPSTAAVLSSTLRPPVW